MRVDIRVDVRVDIRVVNIKAGLGVSHTWHLWAADKRGGNRGSAPSTTFTATYVFHSWRRMRRRRREERKA